MQQYSTADHKPTETQKDLKIFLMLQFQVVMDREVCKAEAWSLHKNLHKPPSSIYFSVWLWQWGHLQMIQIEAYHSSHYEICVLWK